MSEITTGPPDPTGPAGPANLADLIDLAPTARITAFFTTFTDAVMADADLPTLVNRYYTPDFTQLSDTTHFDRDRLLAHLPPLRRNLIACRYEVHEALTDGPTVAARYTIHATLRKAGPVTTDVQMFATFDPDGRAHRITQLTHTPPQS